MRWGVVHDAIENGIGESWLADDVVPAADRQLAGEQGRGAAVAILDDLERRCPGTGVEGAMDRIALEDFLESGSATDLLRDDRLRR